MPPPLRQRPRPNPKPSRPHPRNLLPSVSRAALRTAASPPPPSARRPGLLRAHGVTADEETLAAAAADAGPDRGGGDDAAGRDGSGVLVRRARDVAMEAPSPLSAVAAARGEFAGKKSRLEENSATSVEAKANTSVSDSCAKADGGCGGLRVGGGGRGRREPGVRARRLAPTRSVLQPPPTAAFAHTPSMHWKFAVGCWRVAAVTPTKQGEQTRQSSNPFVQ